MRWTTAHLPGLAVAAAFGLAAVGAAGWLPGVSAIPLALAAGIVIGNSPLLRPPSEAGLRTASRTVLRAGVALVGFRLVAWDVLALGPALVGVIVAIPVVTLLVTSAITRSLGSSRALGLLAGVGFAICGASAIAAVQGLIDADEEDVGAAVGMVLLFGTISMVALPLLAAVWGLDERSTGVWIGAAVHDVGQVVAASASAGDDVLATAILVKLGRVLLLAPLILVLSSLHRARASGPVRPGGPIPLFVVAFLAAAMARTAGWVPEDAVAVIARVEQLLLATALFALGTQIRWQRLKALGIRSVLAGGLSWLALTMLAAAAALTVA